MFNPLLLCFIFLGVSVCAQSDTLPWSIDLDDIVITAQYAPTEARNAVHHVAVVRRQEWEEQGVNDLSELLQRQMTLQVNPDPILGNGLAIQGIGGQNVQIMIDGVPVVGRLGGEIDLTQLNLAQFARVEIVSGAMSARYGSDAAGGVINLITAREQEKPWKLEAGGQLESIDLDRQHLRLGRQFGAFQVDGGINRYVARFAPEDSLRSGATPWNPKEQLSYDANVRYRPSDSLQLRYGYRRFTETVSLLGDIRRPQFRPYVVDEIYTTLREDHSLGGSLRLSPGLNADLTTGWNTFERDKRSIRRDLEPDTTRLLPGGQDTTRYTGQLLRLSVSTQGERTLGGQFGVEYRRESGLGGRILDTATQSREPAISNLAAWAALRYRLNTTLTLEATARVGYNSRYDHPVVPALHLLWRPTEQWRWRLGYATGFRAPAIQELFFNFIDANHYIIGSQSLAAEKSQNVRLRGEWTGGQRLPLTLEGELFYNRIRERITIADLTGDARFTFINLEEYRTYGGTLQISYAPNEQWSVTIGGALTRVSNQVSSPEDQLPSFLTLGELRNELVFTPANSGFNLRLDHRYIGRRDRYVVTDQGVRQGYIGDYHLLHLTARQNFWRDRIALTAGVKNLLNRDRVPVTGGSGGGAHSGSSGGRLVDFGRNFFVGLRWRL